MEWLILFIASWVVFLLLIDWKTFRVNVWSGLLAVVMQLSVDTSMISHNLYKINEPLIQLWGSSVFFMLGPVFTIGTLLTQYYPEKRIFQIVNPFAIALLYTLQEVILFLSGALQYTNWSLLNSSIVNISAMIVLSWFSVVVLNKKGLAEN